MVFQKKKTTTFESCNRCLTSVLLLFILWRICFYFPSTYIYIFHFRTTILFTFPFFENSFHCTKSRASFSCRVKIISYSKNEKFWFDFEHIQKSESLTNHKYMPAFVKFSSTLMFFEVLRIRRLSINWYYLYPAEKIVSPCKLMIMVEFSMSSWRLATLKKVNGITEIISRLRDSNANGHKWKSNRFYEFCCSFFQNFEIVPFFPPQGNHYLANMQKKLI